MRPSAMRPYRIFPMLLSLLLLALSLTASAAQDDSDTLPAGDPAHLLSLLAYVPDTLENRRELLYYTDTAAALAARPAAGTYETVTAWGADDSERASIFLQTLVLPHSIAQYLISMDNTVELVGFDPFDIERGVEFGLPPANGTILQGDFDPQTIINAHTLRDYTQEAIASDVTLLCGPDGCESGMDINFEAIDTANPFGGHLGRQQPVVIAGQNVVYSSAAIAVIESMTEAATDERPSLADSGEYQAVVSALQGDDLGLLRQAIITHGITVGVQPGPPTSFDMTTGTPAPTAEAPAALPPYSLFALADMATEDEQIAVIALVYTTEQDARTALEIVLEQLQTAQSIAVRLPWAELVSDRGMTLEGERVVASEDGGRFVALLTFRYPLPSDTRGSDILDRVEMSGLGYRLFMDGLFRRDLPWLAYEFGG